MRILHRFAECSECKWFKINKPHPNCFQCPSGEFFEERIDDAEPDAEELMRIYGKMKRNERDGNDERD